MGLLQGPEPSRVQLFPAPGEAPWPPKRPFAAIAIDNVLDAVTDVWRHARRMDYQVSPACMHACMLACRGRPHSEARREPNMKLPALGLAIALLWC